MLTCVTLNRREHGDASNDAIKRYFWTLGGATFSTQNAQAASMLFLMP